MKKLFSIVFLFAASCSFAQSTPTYMRGLKQLDVMVTLQGSDLSTRSLLTEDQTRSMVELKLRLVGIEVVPDHYEEIVVLIQGLAATGAGMAIHIEVSVRRPSATYSDIASVLATENNSGKVLDLSTQLRDFADVVYKSAVWQDGGLATFGNTALDTNIKNMLDTYLTKFANEYLKENPKQ